MTCPVEVAKAEEAAHVRKQNAYIITSHLGELPPDLLAVHVRVP